MTKQIDVVGAVIVRDGRILCARRGAGGAQAGLWEFPGGKVEVGESPARALVREIREELGCTIAAIGLEAGPLSQWLHRGLTAAGWPASGFQLAAVWLQRGWRGKVAVGNLEIA